MIFLKLVILIKPKLSFTPIVFVPEALFMAMPMNSLASRVVPSASKPTMFPAIKTSEEALSTSP